MDKTFEELRVEEVTNILFIDFLIFIYNCADPYFANLHSESNDSNADYKFVMEYENTGISKDNNDYFHLAIDRNNWHILNAYHQTYLFDSLNGTFEDYSYSEPQQRMEIFPELKGSAIDFERFLENYFFGTAFLMDPDRFNNMSPEEKKRFNLNDPCLFLSLIHI